MGNRKILIAYPIPYNRKNAYIIERIENRENRKNIRKYKNRIENNSIIFSIKNNRKYNIIKYLLKKEEMYRSPS